MTKSISIVFNGVTFRRYPDSKNAADRRYYKPSGADHKKGIQALHQEVWKSIHGPIPEGSHVHHADHDTENNDPSNLVLIEGRKHASHHGKDPARRPAQRRAIAKAQEAAKEWHASPEGREWRRRHAVESIAARPLVERTCEQCGETYESKGNGRDRFCSNRCRAAARRAAGADNETRYCAFCSGKFVTNRFKPARYCSKSCSASAQHASREAAEDFGA